VNKATLNVPLPWFDKIEQRILDELSKAGGDIFRTELRARLGGSHTTFGRKIESLKTKGVIEEYKRRNGRLRTAYKLTEYASRLFNLQTVLKMKRWFSASQKIELFPEFENIAKALTGEKTNVYKMLGIQPQHMFLETLLAANEPPALEEEEIREILTMCSAFLQNLVTGRLHPRLEEKAEGHIIFHYQLQKPKEEFQSIFLPCLMSYVSESDPLQRHRASSKIIELAIQDPNFPEALSLIATNAARSQDMKRELHDLLDKYKFYKKNMEGVRKQDRELALTELVISALSIFKALYDSSQKKRMIPVLSETS